MAVAEDVKQGATVAQQGYELESIVENQDDHPMRQQSQSMPSADGGRDAYSILAGACVLESVVWGFPFTFGVFQDYYRSHEPFKAHPSGIAAISTTASGLMYLASPVVAFIVQRWPRTARPLGFIGLAVTAGSLVGASFSNNITTLLATQGVIYAIGGSALYFPAMYLIDEWFTMRKGLTYGITWAGTGVSGAVVPFVAQWLLDRYGFRTALRVWSVIMVVLALPSTWVMKSRLPKSRSATMRPHDLSFMKRSPFWWFQFANFCQAIAYFMPQLWVPSFATSLGFPSISGPLALCLMNIATILGFTGQGMLIDRMHVTHVMLLSTGISLISILVFWGLATTPAMLYVFSILWGLTGASFAVTWTGCSKAIKRAEEQALGSDSYGTRIDAGLLIGLLCIGKGIGSLISGPISERLLRAGSWHGAEFAYGSEYGVIIVFCGVTALFGASASIGKICKVM